ncbi:MAG: transposase [Candidatus Sericytochromatia bacterium]
MSQSQIEDLKLAASLLKGAQRRAFEAAMALKYCQGNARQTELVFGWGRHTVELGLNEARTGITCLGAHAARSGNKLWEEKYPEAAEILWGLAESHAQQDPTFLTAVTFTRLTAAEALKQLRAYGVQEEQLPSPSSMADILNRNGYRLRPIAKAKPKKNSRKPMRSLTISRPKTPKAERTPNA